MIVIQSKQDCCGCSACVQRCPKHCISLKEDKEGFLYPDVDIRACIDCGLCEKVCPMLNHPETATRPIEVYVTKNRDEEIRRTSSSGGVFSAVATQIIKDDGVVFGACFNPAWEVIHDYAETQEDLRKFQGSKYVQSRIGNAYQLVESFLKKGRKVLFSGTPCQIAGLHSFLQKDYDNLYTIDIICHGVPSPGVWREYLEEETARQCDGKKSVLTHPKDKIGDVRIENISFRDKRLGWKKFSFALTLSVPVGHGAKKSVLLSEPLDKNIFLRGFLADLYLRPSCHACPVKKFKSGSDVTIGDFWGVQNVMPEIDDDKGMSALLVNNIHGKNILNKLGVDMWRTDYENVLRSNPAIEKSVSMPKNRKHFYNNSSKSVEFRVKKYTCPTMREQIKLVIRKIVAVIRDNKQYLA